MEPNTRFWLLYQTPLIAWIIGLTHWIFGHHTWAVRLPACWIHLITALLLWRGASWLFGQQAARLAALIWISLPATGLGSFLISTDTPLLALWSAGLLAICGMPVDAYHHPSVWVLRSGIRHRDACHPSPFALIGLVLIYLHGHITRQKLFHWRDIGIALLAFGLAASPIIIWNFANEFSTVIHLGDNANISQQSASMAGVWQFIGGQFAVAGPVVLLLMIIATITQWCDYKSRWLIWMSVPVLALMRSNPTSAKPMPIGR